MQEIGADESQRLDIVPAQYRVIVTRRPNIISRACTCTVVQAAAPERLIKGGLPPTERLVAHVLGSCQCAPPAVAAGPIAPIS